MRIPVVQVVCLLLASGAACRMAAAGVRLPGLFGDGMVLQREANVPLWGWARPGEKVTVRIGGQAVSAVAGADGNWRLALAAMKAGGPFTVSVSGDDGERTFQDVYVGDVWLCSGQSNMDTRVRDEPNAAEELSGADYPRIRLFRVPSGASAAPRDDVKGQWTACNRQTAGGFPGLPYFFAKKLQKDLDVPIGLLHAAVGDSSILAWMSPRSLSAEPALKQRVEAAQRLGKDVAKLMAEASGKVPNSLRSNGSFLYNAMISPLVGYGIRGAIWFQGEKDTDRCQEYRLCFGAMVSDWRRSWGGGEFPFLFVQISTYKGWGDVQARPDPEPNEGTWGFFREAQTQCLAVSNTAMAVSLDRQDFEEAHTRNKRAVGERLALAALAKAYGKDVEFSGPLYESMKVEGGKLRLRFTHAGGKLAVQGEKGKNGFAIAGQDRNFVWAEVAVEGESLLVWSDEVPQPAAVRYAWANFPYFGLTNGKGLPAPTFRTDDWPQAAGK